MGQFICSKQELLRFFYNQQEIIEESRPLPPLPRRLSASRELSHRRQLSDLVLRLPQSSSLLLLQQHVKNVARPHYSLPALSRSNALRLCFSAQITTGTAFWPTTGFAALYTSRAPFLA